MAENSARVSQSLEVETTTNGGYVSGRILRGGRKGYNLKPYTYCFLNPRELASQVHSLGLKFLALNIPVLFLPTPSGEVRVVIYCWPEPDLVQLDRKVGLNVPRENKEEQRG